jgi:murein DD-endopeptidase MepM/ murein hydrolase activator NlpD
MTANEKLVFVLIIIFALILFFAGIKLYKMPDVQKFFSKSDLVISPSYTFSITSMQKTINKESFFNSLNDLNDFLAETRQKLALLHQDENNAYDILSRIELQSQLADFFDVKLDQYIVKNSWEMTFSDLAGNDFQMPLKDGIIIDNEYYFPGAVRRYRNGIHQGIDLSYISDHTRLPEGSDIYSISDGTVVKITEYEYYSRQRDFFNLLSQCAKEKYTNDKYLDIFRGKQVQVKSGNVLLIYCHLDGFNKQLKVGMNVKKGDLIGYMGNSGLEYIGSKPHLHLELYYNSLIPGVNRERTPYWFELQLFRAIFKR